MYVTICYAFFSSTLKGLCQLVILALGFLVGVTSVKILLFRAVIQYGTGRESTYKLYVI